ncbi:MAG TPA: cysteine--1-D-myo-inosityl 2-amino-2-deoxy-alpha-D-glucopyranoside ligase [Frankiaceae bacterium]|nr:cysteine--1-D-myo-inosityl 2-amino-2-deoxy-alpha-D-glucopyranoside ligase [Frankiaceae bacterium]
MRAWSAPELPRLPGTGLPLRIYDTAGAEVRPLAPGATATMYVCGITPYDATHLGHAATYLAYDILQRVLRDGGHDVTYVQNVTDVDDPLLERAIRDGEDWRELAVRETERFRGDMEALRILPPAHYVGAVEAIPLIVRLIECIRERGAAYDIEGDLYFSVSSAPRFGEVGSFSHAQMVQLAASHGGDPERPGKKDPLDPLLWRAERPGEPAWDSPFGPGRPGWHVECAAIALEHLGDTIDVQGGGTDLVFPHHECGAAHAEVATGVWPFARAYVHAAMVAYQGEKMSKSLGNLVFISKLREGGADPGAIRLALLPHRYGDAWEWTDEELDAASERLARWREAVARPSGPSAEALLARVRERLADDLDTPMALLAVDRWAREAVTTGGRDTAAPGLVRDLVDALLGVRL